MIYTYFVVFKCEVFCNLLLFVSLYVGSYDGPFDIKRGMGAIVIARPLDAEAQSLYNMSVQVTDGTNTATTQVGVCSHQGMLLLYCSN